MEKLKQSHDVNVTWRSFELRPAGSPPPSPEYRARVEADRPRLLAIAREHYGLELKPGLYGINSRPALIGSKYAEAQGVGEAYHDAVFGAYWLEGRRIDDREELASIAVAVGLDRDAFLAALDDPQWEAAVEADIAMAQASGLSAVPALVFEEKYLVSGAQPYAVLSQATEQIAQEVGKTSE